MGDRSTSTESAGPDLLARRFEAVVLVGDRPARSAEVLAVVRELLDAAMPVVLVVTAPSDPAWPTDPIPLSPEAARWTGDTRAALTELWDRGISPGCTLVVVDDPGADPSQDSGRDGPLLIDAVVVRIDQRDHRAEHRTVHLQGGLDQVLALLTDQLDRRRRQELPVPATTPGWVLTIEGVDPAQERVHEALLTLSDGLVGISGAPSLAHASTTPLVVHAGVYDGGDGIETHLLECPLPVLLHGDLPPDAMVRRVLDLRAGVLGEEITAASGDSHSTRFTSIVRRGLLVHRVHAGPGEARLPDRLLTPPLATVPLAHVASEGVEWVEVGGSPGGVTVAARAADSIDAAGATRTQWTSYLAEPDSTPSPERVVEQLNDPPAESFDHLLDAHRRGWARRWADADVVVEGDDELQLALRFALFQLMGAASDADEAAVGARGVTGSGYRGHVFWDADTFILPFFAATHPRAARAMLEYRIRRLPAALATARDQGRGGARFPWESARTGRDVTPLSARDRTGRLVPIRTGQLEDHIVADVAWAARCYVDWTGDEDFARGGRLAAVRRDGALLGVPHPAGLGGARTHLRCHRSRRVPRTGRRQRVHQRHGAVEPAPGGPARRSERPRT